MGSWSILRRCHPAACVAAAVFLFACGDLEVRKNPVPSGELLTAADCAPALEAYRQILQRPSSVGSVVTNRVATTRPQEVQDRALQAFAEQCPSRFVGHARRAIVRCWTDAPDVETFQTCSQRF